MPRATMSPFSLKRPPSVTLQRTGKYASVCAITTTLELGQGSYLPSPDAQYSVHLTPAKLAIIDLATHAFSYTLELGNAPINLKWSSGGQLAVQTSPNELLLISSNPQGQFTSQPLKRPFKIAAIYWSGEVVAVSSGFSALMELWSLELKLLGALPQIVGFPHVVRDFDQFSVQVSRCVTDSQVHFLDGGRLATTWSLRSTRITSYSPCPLRVQAVCASTHSLFVLSPSAILAQIRFFPSHIRHVNWLHCGEIVVSTVASVEVYDFDLVSLAAIGPTLRTQHLYYISAPDEPLHMVDPKQFKLVNPVVHDQPIGRFWAVESSGNFVAIISSMHAIKAIIDWAPDAKPVALLWSEIHDTFLLVFTRAVYKWTQSSGLALYFKHDWPIKGAMVVSSTLMFWDAQRLHTCSVGAQYTLPPDADDRVNDTFELKRLKLI